MAFVHLIFTVSSSLLSFGATAHLFKYHFYSAREWSMLAALLVCLLLLLINVYASAQYILALRGRHKTALFKMSCIVLLGTVAGMLFFVLLFTSNFCRHMQDCYGSIDQVKTDLQSLTLTAIVMLDGEPLVPNVLGAPVHASSDACDRQGGFFDIDETEEVLTRLRSWHWYVRDMQCAIGTDGRSFMVEFRVPTEGGYMCTDTNIGPTLQAQPAVHRGGPDDVASCQ